MKLYTNVYTSMGPLYIKPTERVVHRENEGIPWIMDAIAIQ